MVLKIKILKYKFCVKNRNTASFERFQPISIVINAWAWEREKKREINIQTIFFFSLGHLSISLILSPNGCVYRAIALHSLLFYPGVILHTTIFLYANIYTDSSLTLSFLSKSVYIKSRSKWLIHTIFYSPISPSLSQLTKIDREEIWRNGQRLNGGSLYSTPLQQNSIDGRWCYIS
jgi:hypothetical protein